MKIHESALHITSEQRKKEHGLRVRTKQSVHARHTNFFKRYEVTK